MGRMTAGMQIAAALGASMVLDVTPRRRYDFDLDLPLDYGPVPGKRLSSPADPVKKRQRAAQRKARRITRNKAR